MFCPVHNPERILGIGRFLPKLLGITQGNGGIRVPGDKKNRAFAHARDIPERIHEIEINPGQSRSLPKNQRRKRETGQMRPDAHMRLEISAQIGERTVQNQRLHVRIAGSHDRRRSGPHGIADDADVLITQLFGVINRPQKIPLLKIPHRNHSSRRSPGIPEIKEQRADPFLIKSLRHRQSRFIQTAVGGVTVGFDHNRL